MTILSYHTEGLNKFEVFWTDNLNGGGMYFGSEYPNLIRTLYPNRIFKNCLEWCSGPGFIGYNLLDFGLCENLILTDLYQPAIDIAYQTAQHNNLLDKVQFYCSDKIENLPKHLKFDLVVGNPPHYDRPYINENSRIADDPDWLIHKQFYNNIYHYLSDDGVVILQENEDGSTINDFQNMILDSNLKISNVIKSPKYYESKPTLIYYIEVTK
jgi:methylase of polypeptide subunit release factors